MKRFLVTRALWLWLIGFILLVMSGSYWVFALPFYVGAIMLVAAITAPRHWPPNGT